MLLQRLLARRRRVAVVFSGALDSGAILCSCGAEFSECGEIENHLVSHHEPEGDEDENNNVSVTAAIRSLLVFLETQDQQRPFKEVPSRTYLALLDEVCIGGSKKVMNIPCSICGKVLHDFDGLKRHFLELHPAKWRMKAMDQHCALSTRRDVVNREHKGCVIACYQNFFIY